MFWFHVRRMGWCMLVLGLTVCLSGWSVSRAEGAIRFEFVYLSPVGTGTGFEDAVLGQARRDALSQAAALFGSWFDQTATVTINAFSSNSNSSQTVAAANTATVGAGGTGFGKIEVVASKIFDGIDLNGSSADGALLVNWAKPWDVNVDPTAVDSGKLDFYSAVFHELSHVLGFFSSIRANGTDLFATPPGRSGKWSGFDGFITDAQGVPVIDPVTFALNQTLWDRQSVGGASPANGLFFNGPNAVAANGGQPVGLYTPSRFNPGSSVSHLDEQNPVLRSMLLSAAGSLGPGPRRLSDVEIAMFEDLGYTFTAGGLTPGDANADGRVDAEDLNIITLYWQRSVVNGPSQGDFNGDGITDADDLNLLAQYWQLGVPGANTTTSSRELPSAGADWEFYKTPSASITVPELSLVGPWLCGFGLLMDCYVRRRR